MAIELPLAVDIIQTNPAASINLLSKISSEGCSTRNLLRNLLRSLLGSPGFKPWLLDIKLSSSYTLPSLRRLDLGSIAYVYGLFEIKVARISV